MKCDVQCANEADFSISTESFKGNVCSAHLYVKKHSANEIVIRPITLEGQKQAYEASKQQERLTWSEWLDLLTEVLDAWAEERQEKKQECDHISSCCKDCCSNLSCRKMDEPVTDVPQVVEVDEIKSVPLGKYCLDECCKPTGTPIDEPTLNELAWQLKDRDISVNEFTAKLRQLIDKQVREAQTKQFSLRVKTRLWTPKGYDQYDNTWKPQNLALRQKMKIPLDAYGKSFVEVELQAEDRN